MSEDLGREDPGRVIGGEIRCYQDTCPPCKAQLTVDENTKSRLRKDPENSSKFATTWAAKDRRMASSWVDRRPKEPGHRQTPSLKKVLPVV